MARQALLYVRVSSKVQENEGYSLDAQEKLGHEYARRKDLRIIRTWRVSESAWKLERKAFGQMVDFAARHPEVGHIIFDVLDRMTRNDFDKLKIHRLIKENGKTIHFSRSNRTLDRGSGPDEEFLFDIEVAVAKKMSNDISRKTRMGLLEKAAQGFYPSVAPVGYQNNPLTHRIEADDDRVVFVRKAFVMMASGACSLSIIVKALHQDGFLGKKGHHVGKSAIEMILKNPIYYGAFRWLGKTLAGSHIPIVTKELFDKAQAVLRGRRRPKLSHREFAFNNLLRCGACGCKVIGEVKKERFVYYHCTFSKGRHDGKGYFREDRIAEMFEESIKRINLNEDAVERLRQRFGEMERSSTHHQVKRLETLKSEYEMVKRRLSRLYDAKFDGELNGEMFAVKEAEYNSRLLEIRNEMEVERTDAGFFENVRQTLELSKSLYQRYLTSNCEEKAEILKLVASNYTLTDVSIVPTYRKPFDMIVEGLSVLNGSLVKGITNPLTISL